MNMKMPVILIDDNARFAAVALFADHPRVETFIIETRARLYAPYNKVSIPFSYESEFTVGKEIFYRFSDKEIVKRNTLINERDILQLQDVPNSRTRLREIETYFDSLISDGSRFRDDIKEFTHFYIPFREYETALEKLILSHEVREVDYQGEGLRGRYDKIKIQRQLYWENRKASGKDRLGYKRLSVKNQMNHKTIEQEIRSYKRRLQGLNLD